MQINIIRHKGGSLQCREETENRPLSPRIAEGEAEYMKILQEAYNTPEKADFYNFMRSLDALKASLKGDNKTIILDKDSELARILYGGNLSVPGSGGQE